MTRQTLIALALTGLCSSYALGQHIPGHGAPAGAMPAGHPALPGGSAASMPAGHPAVPGDTTGGMPAGHPGVPGMAATAQAASFTLTVKAVPGTKNAPSLAKEKAKVDLYAEDGKVAKTYEVTLDDKGIARIEKIPTTPPTQCLVTMTYSGVDQQAVGPIIDGQSATGEVTIPIYQSTDKPIVWTIPGRRLMLSATDTDLKVRDQVAVGNEADRVWPGPTTGPDKGQTAAIGLPKGVDSLDIRIGGENYARIIDGALRIFAPMFPGARIYPLNYHLPLNKGTVELVMTATAPTAEIQVLLPDTWTAKSDVLKESDPIMMGHGKARVLAAKDIKAGQTLTLTLTNVTKGMIGRPAMVAPAATGKPEGHP